MNEMMIRNVHGNSHGEYTEHLKRYVKILLERNVR